MRRSVLLVAQLGPPSEIVAARRTAALAKYLARLGHPVIVLTSVRSGRGTIDGAAETIRTLDLAATGLNWRRRRHGNRAVDAPTGAARGIEAHVVPDIALLTWLPFALPRALALSRRAHFDCVITTSPPSSTHLIGLALQRRGVSWIADLRDGWTFDPPRPPWPLESERRLDAALERRVVRQADVVLGVTSPIVEDLHERLGVDARLLSNGYDPDERQTTDPAWARSLLSPDRHSLVHTGRAGVSGRSPRALFDALKILLRRRPDTAERLEIVFAGSVSSEERRLLSDPQLRGIVRAVGTLPRPRALALQQTADSLLVMPAGAAEPSVATGKLFEYLTAGPPILVVGARSEAARIVRDTGTGIAVPADSPPEIAEALERLMEGLPTTPNSAAISAYSWVVLAERASELIQGLRASGPAASVSNGSE